ncbi:hypothetical protein ACJJTC_008547 [Scirpophaga incertulas]
MLIYTIASCLLATATAGPAVIRSRREIEDFRSALLASVAGDGLTLEKRMNKNLGSSPWASSGKYQGDILLDKAIIEAMVTKYATGRSGLVDPYQLWPNATIIYEFAAKNFCKYQNYVPKYKKRSYFESHERSIEQNSCIKFRPRTTFIAIVSTSG